METNKEFVGTIICSLCLLRKDGRVLLGRKMKKHVAGWWNGYGGRQDPGEPIRLTTARELLEETGEGVVVHPEDLVRRAVVYFHNQDENGNEFTIKVHVLEAWNWEGEPKETDEMTAPTWFPENGLPWDDMPPGDPYWLSLFLAGKNVVGHISYGPKQKYLRGEPTIRTVEDLDEVEPED